MANNSGCGPRRNGDNHGRRSGAQRGFQPDSRTAGAYFSQPGDTGTLTADGHGGYLLTEADGTATDYNANGTLNYMQDTNGNRISAGFTSGKLTSLTATSGQSITIAYNSAGLISSVGDSEGRTTIYAYDSQNQHLVSVTGYNGQTTRYSYNTTSGSAALNALTSITFPGGTHQEYLTYDNQGRVTGTSNDGGARGQETFAYALGQVSAKDGTGATSNVYYNEQGLVVKSLDALGNVTLNTYDSDFNLLKVTDAVGESESYTYNAAGEVSVVNRPTWQHNLFHLFGAVQPNEFDDRREWDRHQLQLQFHRRPAEHHVCGWKILVVDLRPGGKCHLVPKRRRPADQLHV